jgi:DNA-binding beta-propeller fold protein YncE
MLLVTLGVLAAALVLSSPSLAGEPRHVFDRSLKSTAPCEFTEPSGVAVNEQTHDVFVYDRSSNSINWLDAGGHCILHHQAGKGTSGEEGKEGLAIDNSSGPSAGDLYVANAEEHAILKFKPEVVEGKPVLKRIQTIKRFRKKEVGAEEFLFEEEVHGIAVDAGGALWVYAGERTLLGFSGGVPNEALSMTEVGGECAGRSGLAVSGNGEFFYVGKERENRKAECEEATVAVKVNSAGEPYPPTESETAPAFHAQLDNEPNTGVAVDQASADVYFDNAKNVSAFSGTGIFLERFANEGAGQLHESAGITVDAATHDVYAADTFEGKVNVYVLNKAKPPPPGPTEGLPDKRAFEMVSPPNKLGAGLIPITIGAGGLVQAAAGGDAITYSASGPIVESPPTNRSPEAPSIISRRNPESWASEDIATPRSQVPIGYSSGDGTEYRFFSSDLSFALVEPDIGIPLSTEQPLSPEPTESKETTVYLRKTTPSPSHCEPVPSACYEAIVSPANAQSGYGGKLHLLTATSDASHVVVASEAPLTSGAPERGLYEWGPNEQLKLISVPPSGETVSVPRLGAPTASHLGGVFRHAISNDGSRVFWSSTEQAPEGSSEEEGALYMRDTVAGTTFRLDTPEPGVEGAPAGAAFQTASDDGSRVFFTDTSKLTTDATDGPNKEEREEGVVEGKGDLYMCEVVEEEPGKPGCKKPLTDLTAQVSAPNESAAVQGVIGASEDGSYVYFVANGALGSGGGRGNCVPREPVQLQEEQEGKIPVLACELYVDHYSTAPEHEGWEGPQPIAPLTTEDQGSWHVNSANGALAAVSSRVSPKGQFLAFMSNSPLTGYDNRDANPEAHEARDEEVFLFNFATQRISCASCNPNPATRPSGVFDGGNNELSSEGQGRLVDRAFGWPGHWLAGSVPGWTAVSAEHADYQSRYLSDTGRLFFNASDGLVPADKNGKEDVYQYELNHEGTCESESGCIAVLSGGSSKQESAFLDASENGNDIFFLTSAQLLPQDKDTAFDVYDARVCTESSACLKPPAEPEPPCTGEACKAPITSAQALPSAPASSLPGTGNQGKEVLSEIKKKPPPKLTPKQRLAKELKSCKKLKKKKKRAACVRLAKKRYALATKAAKHSPKAKK